MYEAYHVLGDFNPRSREGSDDAPLLLHEQLVYFNPRSREGSDGVLRKDYVRR